MKITISFPKGGSDTHRPEVEAEVSVIPRIGEWLTWNGAKNFEVKKVIHTITGRDCDDDNAASHQVIVAVE